jgi:hypothetical protein
MLEKIKIKIGRISFAKRTGWTYLTLVRVTGKNKLGRDEYKVVGKITLYEQYPIFNCKEVIFDGE